MNVSERLQETLTDYLLEGDPVGIEDLGRVVRRGDKPWFVTEFEAALQAGAFTPQWWGTTLYHDEWTDEDADELDRDLRLVWTAIAPDRPYPLDT
mgnify:CR=1 FL=1